MKINMLIIDATPEEAALVASVLVPVGKADPVRTDPTCDEETGCAGCDCTGFDECDQCSPGKTRASGPVKAGNHKGNKFGIPPEIRKTDKKKYDRLWQRCKIKGIRYEEALTQEKQSVKPITSTDEQKAPKAPRERLPFHQDKTPEIVGTPISGKVITLYEGKITGAPTLDKIPKDTNIVGWKVKQVQPDKGRQIAAPGIVLARRGELIEIRDSNGKRHIIDSRCLQRENS